MSLLFIVDADIARSSGTSEHPISSGSRRLLDGLAQAGHKAAMCPVLRQEWKKHQSGFATRWLASMVAKKRVVFVNPTTEIRDFIETNVVESKEKDIAVKDAHLIDAALIADKIVTSNDDNARAAFCS